MKIKKIFKVAFITLVVGSISTLLANIDFKIFSQNSTPPENGQSMRTCYTPVPLDLKQVQELQELQEQMEKIENLYKQKKINQKTYEERKSDLQKQINDINFPKP
ncbi:MAG: hypothetical protein AB1782_09430 [Cyanobacteriota bacterium]